MADMDTVKFLRDLKRYKVVLPKQTMKTLKWQALSGDLEGAKKGLGTVLRRRAGRCERAQ
ncbi:hypothetical protein ABE29_18200 [Cytobacillus firmus]|nr:hypothetical protein [Cytobacillus firmus]MBG9553627.1 hypothetical protein [Cytobacillus firmus]MBG9577077.1 hypothetical protein [Cytobacillus firmus]